MEGEGEYSLSTGTVYRGAFCDGMFHGLGTLFFPNGGRYEGKWKDGIAVEGKYIFPDDLEFKETDWEYCDGYDRRFNTEIKEGLKSSGHTRLTNFEPTRQIPEGCYDCGDGFYVPEKRTVVDYELNFLRYADDDENDWIVSKCRRQKDDYIECDF